MKLQYLFYHSATCADIQTVKMAIMKNCGDHYDIKLDTHQKVVFILILDTRTVRTKILSKSQPISFKNCLQDV
jgi:hypothetical protein